jgi:hypothetical protein
MSNENIFREVDEELRSERMRKLWRQTAPYIIGAAIGIVVLVAANEGWNWWQRSQAAASSEQLYEAFALAEGGDVAAAQAALDEVIANGSGNYPTLARFRQAGLMAAEGQTQEAVALYDTIANAESNPQLRELALVLAATLMVDTGSVADIEARVGAIAVEGNPLRNAAREALGLAYYKAGDYAAAQASFEAILNDPLAQASQRSRVGFYLAQLLAEGVTEDATQEAASAGEAPAAAAEETAAAEAAPAEAAGEQAPAEDAARVEEAAPSAETVPATEAPAAQ